MLEDLVAAWNEGDYTAMTEHFDADSATEWPPQRLATLFERAHTSGAITGITVSLSDTSGSAAGDNPDDAADDAADEATAYLAEYSIAYRSDAADQEILMSGRLSATYSEEDERWTIEWSKELLWPDIPDAHGFDISVTWPRRAPLLDGERRPIAAGPVASRRYPFAAVGGTTVGHLEPLKKKDIVAGDFHEPGDIVGGSGLEAAFERRLAGRPTTKLHVVDRRGTIAETVGHTIGRRADPLRTTLDMDVQRAAESAYGSTTGGAVVLDPRTGDLLAAVSSSPFDPANYVGIAGIEPFNRALSGLYPPGSSLKVMTAAAALETGVVKPTTKLTGPAEYKGVRNFESGEFGTLTFADALTNSVNTAFAQVAEDLGAERLDRFADAFGFDRAPAMPLGAATSSFPFPADEGDVMWGSIGQAQVLATPLHMATIAATVANRGRRMEPRITFNQEKHGTRVVTRQVARTLTGLMESVVQEGTGVAAQISGVRVAGKTGTAEVDVDGERKNHAWFIAFAPADDPKVAIAVVSEYGGVGGQVAAPLARAILTAVLPLVR